MKPLLLIQVTCILTLLCGCEFDKSMSNVISCNQVIEINIADGVCEGYGIAVRPADRPSKYIEFPSGVKGGLALSLYPEIENGDTVYVKGSFYRNGKNFEFEQIEVLRVESR